MCGRWLVNTKFTFFKMFELSDIKKQIHDLATSVYQIRGHIKGKTLLPFPQVHQPVQENSDLQAGIWFGSVAPSPIITFFLLIFILFYFILFHFIFFTFILFYINLYHFFFTFYMFC